MKYESTMGVELDVKPIGIKEREKFLAVKKVQEAFSDSPSWEERLEMHDHFLALCELCNIAGGAVGEGDIVPVISILLNGCLPSDFPTPR